MLDQEAFLQVVRHAPLVSVDLIVVRGGTEALLGLRNNRPAQGMWFVPGGRITKNERIEEALLRVAQAEAGLGDALRAGKLTARPMGAYQHFYPDCFAGEKVASTHYVALGYRVHVPDAFELPRTDAQHAAFKWWPVQALLASPLVHQHTKDYFLTEDEK